MARLDVKTQDPERYAQVKAEQEELKLQFSMAAFGTSVARLCPYCEHKRYICELQDVRYILYEPFKSAEDAAAFIRTILKEHHVHIKTAAADDIALCREKYNLLKRRKLR